LRFSVDDRDTSEAVALKCAEKFSRHARTRFVVEYVSGEISNADCSSRSGESVSSTDEQYEEHAEEDDDEGQDEE